MPLSLGEVVPATTNKKRVAQYQPVVAEIQEEKHMNYAKIGLDDLTVPAQIQYGRRLIAGITDNPTIFVTPNPSMAAFTAQVDELEAAYNEALAARLNAKTLTQVLEDRVDAFGSSVSLLASYVDNTSGGDGPVIERSGFALRATPTPIGPLPAPTDVQAIASDHPGSADVGCKAMYGARTYLFQRAVDAPTLEWKPIGASTKREGQFNSMVSGQKYWFRMAVVGTAGQSAWSDPVPFYAPY